MEKRDQEITIRRILVALDASTHSLAALEAAADLAANMQAELIGLYVEDENLLHLAGLPFSDEVRSSSANRQPMSSDKMERELRLQASQARHALETAATRVAVRWSFRTVRGQVTSSVLAAALEADLLALGRVSRPISRHSRLGSTARAASIKTEGSVLFMQHGGKLKYPVLVTFDGTSAAWQAMITAVKMAQASGNQLNVLFLADSLEATRPMKQEISEWLEKDGLSAEYHWLPQVTVDKLVAMVYTVENCVLVLGGESSLMEAEAIQELLDKTDCPVMLVR